jgi:hypothetical protein
MGASSGRQLRRLLSRAARAAVVAVGVRRAPPPSPFLDRLDRLDRLCAALHRLDREIASLRGVDPRTPGLYHRTCSAVLAYDAVLAEACRTVGVQVPQLQSSDSLARLEAEARLAAAGLTW